jgi:hypothetical protein
MDREIIANTKNAIAHPDIFFISLVDFSRLSIFFVIHTPNKYS